MRVVAGTLRGRRLVAPSGAITRPTTDKVREAVFNALGSLDVVDGALVADLFAGTGALGIEALSRGAERVTFVETNRAALRALNENVDTLELRDRAHVVSASAMSVAATLDVDVVFADPPYDFAGWPALLEALASARGGGPELVVAESGQPIDEDVNGDTWTVSRARRYGRSWVTFLSTSRKRASR